MPKTRLTTAAVERLKPPQTGQIEFFDTHLPSFGLRASYSGAKAYFVTTRIDGKLVRFTLGRHPALSLSEAREKARLIIEQARAGMDPRKLEAEARQREEIERSNTFGNVGQQFLEQYVERNLRPSTARAHRGILLGPDTEKWRTRPVSSISRADVVDLLYRIERRGAPAAASRALVNLSKFFAWAVEQELLTVSPTAGVRALTPSRSRERALTPEEVAWVWKALQGWSSPFAALFKVLLLTGQRRGEVAGMRWAEMHDLGADDAVWALPASRTKNKMAHLVPLAPEVQAILEDVPRVGPLVFTSRSARAASGFDKAKAAIDGRVTALRAEACLPPLSPWTLHDLRRTMVTIMNEHLKVAPHVVEAVVNHISGAAKRGVAGVYNKALYLDERRQALQAWAAFVTSRETTRE